MGLEYKHKTKPYYSGKQEEQIHNYTVHNPSYLKRGQTLLKNVPNLHIIFVLPVFNNSVSVDIDGRLTKYFSEYLFLSSTMMVFLHSNKTRYSSPQQFSPHGRTANFHKVNTLSIHSVDHMMTYTPEFIMPLALLTSARLRISVI